MSVTDNNSLWRGLKLPFYVVLQDRSQARIKRDTVAPENQQQRQQPQHQSQKNEFTSIDYDSIIRSREGPSGAAVKDSELFEHPVNIYPEIRYKFSDDADERGTSGGTGTAHNNGNDVGNPEVSNGGPELAESNVEELSSNDTVLVFDFDASGEKIVDFKCLSNSWQAYSVAKLKNSQISLEGPNNRQRTTNILVKGTNCNVDVGSFANDAGGPNGEEGGAEHDGNNQEDDLGQSVEDIRNMVRLFNERNKQLEQMINLPNTFSR